MKVRAVLHDSEGPLRNRLAPLGLLIVAALLALGSAHPLLVVSIVTLGLTLPGVIFRFSARPVEVVPGGGEIRIHGAGSLSQTITSSKVVGASTAQVEEGVVLTLARRDRRAPTTLIFDSETDLARVREALGIGHGGFGRITWPLVPASSETWAPAYRASAALGAVLSIGLFVYSAHEPDDPSYGVLSLLVLCVSWGLAVLGAIGAAVRAPIQTLTIEPGGVCLCAPISENVPFEGITGFTAEHGSLRVDVGARSHTARYTIGGFAGASLDGEGLRFLRAHIEACVARARGLGPEKAVAQGRTDMLRRGRDTARDWLARIDVAASALRVSGYRGSTIERDDLWLLLRDPDAPEDLRAAAGRLLVRVEGAPDVQPRIRGIVAAVRDPAAQERLQRLIFDDELDELDELDDLEREAGSR